MSADTAMVLGFDIYDNTFHGEHVVCSLAYTRDLSGLGVIAPQLTDRSLNWRYCIERDGDLYRPVVMIYEYYLPADTLYVSESMLEFAAIAGEPSLDSFFVEFTSSSLPIQFGLNPSDPWIVLVDLPLIEIQTPYTQLVKVNTAGLAPGTYNGWIDVSAFTPETIVDVDKIYITLEIVPQQQTYPPGDFNCDGSVDITDLVFFINYLFLGGPAPQYCE
jgi:hypothetical protein